MLKKRKPIPVEMLKKIEPIPVERSNEYLHTDILKDLKGIKDICPASGMRGNAKMYEVLDSRSEVSYIIKQHYQQKNDRGLKLQENAMKEWKLSKLLRKYTDYVGEIIEVQSKEIPSGSHGPVYVATELLMKYEGIDLMRYRRQPKLSSTDLLHVVFQSAIAIAVAHSQGVFHSDVKPNNMLIKNGILKLIDFDVSLEMNSEHLLNKYDTHRTENVEGWTPSYCPPEVLHYKKGLGQLSISQGKIDAYCWGMSMLQFLLNMTYEEFEKNTSLLKNSYKDSSKVLKSINKLKVPELEDTINRCLMRLICKCIRYTPSTRLNMDDVLACLICPNDEFGEIMEAFSPDLRSTYKKEIKKVIGKQVEAQKKPLLSQQEIGQISLYPLDPKFLARANQHTQTEELLARLNQDTQTEEIVSKNNYILYKLVIKYINL